MRIVLIGLASVFTEGLTYQDNLLAEQLRVDGNEVILIVECLKYENGKITEVDEEDRILSNGIRLIRKKYRQILNGFISSKIRSIHGLNDLLNDLNPDIIFHHGLQTFEMVTITKFKKQNPQVKFFVDSHEDNHNSARSILSKYVLHKLFYKLIILYSLPMIDKIFCVTYESFDFLNNIYKIKRERMEFFPLGGIVFEDNEYKTKRNSIRSDFNLKEEDVLIIHSGKMDINKKTNLLLKAFNKTKNSNLKLFLIGSFDEDSYILNKQLIEYDERITFLGWKSGKELVDYLCASDLYIQPGTQSATMQNALCCRNAVAIYPYSSHKYLLGDSAFYIQNENDIQVVLKSISKNIDILKSKKEKCFKIATQVLDYKVLARKLYE